MRFRQVSTITQQILGMEKFILRKLKAKNKTIYFIVCKVLYFKTNNFVFISGNINNQFYLTYWKQRQNNSEGWNKSLQGRRKK